jgi:hypothetical protein
MHELEDEHETPFKALSFAPVRFGVVCICQAVPFQRSAKLMRVPELSSDQPTAVHAVVEEHDMASSELSSSPVGLGLD